MSLPLESNYWLTTTSMPAGSPHSLPARVDVAIIGAGFTGLSAARRLAKNGAAVVVLEANRIGWGASSRNGGMVLAGLKLSAQTLLRRYGTGLARLLYASSLAAVDLVEEVVREEHMQCSFSRCGYLEVASKQSHFEAYARSADLLAHEFHHPIRIIPRGELPSEIASDLYFGGLLDDAGGGINPAQYVSALARAAIEAGASIYEQARVERLQRNSENGSAGFLLITGRGSLFAKDVLVATSGYTSGATPELKKKIVPIGSFIIATEPLPESLTRELSPRKRMISDSRHYLHYYRLTPDNRMLFGGRAAFFPETQNTIRRSAEILRRGMIAVYPQLRDAKLEHAWGGTLDFCFDTMPHAGEINGIHFALGYAGHGVAMATYLGSKIAERMSGERVDIPFDKIPFPGAPLGLYNGRPWFLPLAGAYYRVLDWIS